jgi:hypothetical protein
MDSESDARLERAIGKHVQKARAEAERHRLNGLAAKTKEDHRVEFLAAFAEKCHSCIVPQLDRVEQALDSARSSCTDGAAAREIAIAAVIFDDGDVARLTLTLNGKVAHLSFVADAPRMIVAVGSADGSVNATLNLDQIKDENVGPLVASFVEQAFRVL